MKIVLFLLSLCFIVIIFCGLVFGLVFVGGIIWLEQKECWYFIPLSIFIIVSAFGFFKTFVEEK